MNGLKLYNENHRSLPNLLEAMVGAEFNVIAGYLASSEVDVAVEKARCNAARSARKRSFTEPFLPGLLWLSRSKLLPLFPLPTVSLALSLSSLPAL